jgi:pyroglutamyl-peptidase
MPAFAGMTAARFRRVTEQLRILITGFGAFPGAPFNPTQPLVARLTRLRRPAFSDVDLIGHVFPVTYQAVDRELPHLLARHRPHALLMFGLAARTPYVRIETRARNAITTLWPDANGAYVRSGAITRGAGATNFGPHTLRLLQAARGTGIDARLSRDAGRYLCNYLCRRALEAHRGIDGPRLAAFVHVPLLARDAASSRKAPSDRLTLDHLVDAGEALLLQMVALARRK